MIHTIRIRPRSIIAKHTRSGRSRYNPAAMPGRRDSARDRPPLNNDLFDLMIGRLRGDRMIGLLMIDLAICFSYDIVLLVRVLGSGDRWRGDNACSKKQACSVELLY